MSRRERRDGDRRPGERRDGQPDDEQQRRPSEMETQEGDSLTALKAILAKVAGLLTPLKLTQDESISLVEQLYGSVLEMDLKLAGEADDRRKSSVLAHIQNTAITRTGGKIAVQHPSADQPASDTKSTPSAETDVSQGAAAQPSASESPPSEAPSEAASGEPPTDQS